MKYRAIVLIADGQVDNLGWSHPSPSSVEIPTESVAVHLKDDFVVGIATLSWKGNDLIAEIETINNIDGLVPGIVGTGKS